MQNSPLRLVLRLNAASSLATGLLLAGAASFLAGPMGADAVYLRVAGVALLPFALGVAWLAEQHEPPSRLVAVVSACDFTWVAGSLYVVLATPLTGLGKALVVVVAIVVELFGSAQLWYSSRRATSFGAVRE